MPPVRRTSPATIAGKGALSNRTGLRRRRDDPPLTHARRLRQVPGFPVTHVDLYRLAGPDEVAELGLDEALESGAAVIEWPQRLEGRLPHSRLDIEIEIEGEARRARLTPHGDFEGRPLEF